MDQYTEHSAHSAGQLVQLGQERTWYRIFNSDGAGGRIVLIHGATVPHWEFEALVPRLMAAGYQVLVFDLYGHGASDCPPVDYTHSLFVSQTQQLLEAIDFSPDIIVGHSMGAAIAAAVSDDASIRLVLMAPMLDFSTVNPFSLWLRVPLLGEAFMAAFGRRALIRRRRRRYRLIGREHLAGLYLEQAARDGYWRALLSMERCGALGDQSSVYSRAAERGIAPLILWGTADRIVPRSQVDWIESCFALSQRLDLPGAEHNLMLTHPGEVADAIGKCLPES